MMLILIGHNDAQYLTTGWHPPQEGPAGIPCRWISQRAGLSIPGQQAAQLLTPAPSRGLSARITVSAPAAIRGLKPGLSLYSGDVLLGHCAALGPEGHWYTAIIPINAPLPADKTPFSLTMAIEHRTDDEVTPLAFIPHETLNNGDLRELGALISSIRIDQK